MNMAKRRGEGYRGRRGSLRSRLGESRLTEPIVSEKDYGTLKEARHKENTADDRQVM